MPISASPALRRQDGVDPSMPEVAWDVITFRRRVTSRASTSHIEITIDRAKLARAIGRRAAGNTSRKATSFFGAIAAVILADDGSAETL